MQTIKIENFQHRGCPMFHVEHSGTLSNKLLNLSLTKKGSVNYKKCQCPSQHASIIYIIIEFLINMQVQGHHPHQWDPSSLQVLLSWGSTVVSFHSRQSFSVSFFHVSLGLPAPACQQSVSKQHVISDILKFMSHVAKTKPWRSTG